MPDLNKIPLSGSTHGRPIKVAATAIGSGDTIHTAYATTTDGEGDEVVIYAFNSDSSAVELVLGWGGTTDPDDLIKRTIPAGAWELVIPGLFLRNALIVKASAGTTNVIVLAGYALQAPTA